MPAEKKQESENMVTATPVEDLKNTIKVQPQTEVELKKYAAKVKILAISKSTQPFPNSSPYHAGIVITEMLNVAVSEVRIYDHCLNDDIASKTPKLIPEIEYFLIRGKTLKLALREEEMVKTSNIYLALQYYQKIYSKLDIKIATTTFKDKIKEAYTKDINFAVGDSDMYRIETSDDEELREAWCCFNDPSYSSNLVKIFDQYFVSYCDPIKL